jgi:hypothetical protein
MTGTFTGLEGLLADRILTRRDEDFGTEVSEIATAEAEEEAYSKALRDAVEPVKSRGRIVITTSSKDPDTSTQIAVVGLSNSASQAFNIALAAAPHLAALNAAQRVSQNTSFLEYWEAVQGFVSVSPLALQSLALTPNLSSYFTHSLLQTSDRERVHGEGWLSEAVSELIERLEELDAEKKDLLSKLSEPVLSEAANASVNAPAIDLDYQGNVHLFWKRDDEGLLAVIRADRSIHFFGSSKGESFRSDYQLDGKTWRVHLKVYLQPLSNDVITA